MVLPRLLLGFWGEGAGLHSPSKAPEIECFIKIQSSESNNIQPNTPTFSKVTCHAPDGAELACWTLKEDTGCREG